MTEREKVTYALPAGLTARMRAEVEAGRARSQAGLVQEAVETYLDRANDRRLAEEWAAAAKDPAFAADMAAVARDFDGLDTWPDDEPT